jgi:AcrR family transcriptional regulator
MVRAVLIGPGAGRRDEILSATWRVIVRDGIAGAAVRAIAREARCPPGILAHSLDGKAGITGAALAPAHRRAAARTDAKTAGRAGPDALRLVMPEARRQGGLPGSADIDLAARRLLVLTGGLSAERVLYPGRVTAARQKQMLNELPGSLRRRPG